ncbi:fibronectin type III domain-containing protein 10 [Hyperolius riggenbachi]|uniref:fibronectin type III domain-containing protein 10 n=1 Tax=Hyperolius riggenbachi TaxID=752182 RepID=UPI0035A31DBB
MIRFYSGTLQSLLLICLFYWSPVPVMGDWERIPGAREPSSSLEPSNAGSALVQRYLQRYRRGTNTVNITRQPSHLSLLPNESVCPYKVFSEGRENYRSLCFRTMASDFHCDQRNCHLYKSGRSLMANVLRNSSVLLQWQPPALSMANLKGFFINCSWNGTFTRFQCDSVQLGVNCRDYLLTNVHDNVKYRICLQTLFTNRTSREECVDFVVEPLGMQDIVIAMTAVGGSICVMLVIICLLVAYITENLMNPTFMHSSSKRGP